MSPHVIAKYLLRYPPKNSVFYFKCRVLEYKEQVYINRSYLILVAEQVVVKNTLSIIDM